MIEVAAFMIDDIVQCYPRKYYNAPYPIVAGMLLEKDMPKSMYRPGRSTDILMLQENRVAFADDLVSNRDDSRVSYRYSVGFGEGLIQTDIRVRSLLALENCQSV